MPGDVYSAPPYEGRGGWSWYTGSAAWMWRAALEGLLGLSLRPGAVRLRPCLPVHWPHARVTLRLGGRELQVLLQRAELPVPRDSIPIAVDQWIDTTGLADGSVLCAVLAPSQAAEQPSLATVVQPGPLAG
jgi:cyclic beta-1,2-glucan synthetase